MKVKGYTAPVVSYHPKRATAAAARAAAAGDPGGGGSAVTITEPTTGIDTSITIDGTGVSSVANHSILYNQKSHFLEYLKLEYAITSTQKANLLAFWQNKYEE